MHLTKKSGFTLAEILIVIGIIGVIATMVIPTVVSNIMNDVYTKAKTVTIKKITEATDQMKTNKVLAGYSTTDAFVDELQKYLKITTRCSSTQLTKCFPSSFKNEGLSYTTNNIQTGSGLGQGTYTSPNVGLVLADGTFLIMAFNPNCEEIPWWNNSTSTTSCISMIYDTNGMKGPNEIGKDIGSLNAKFLVKVGTFYITPNDVTYSPVVAYPYSDATNYWQGALLTCMSLGLSTPSNVDLNAISKTAAIDLGMYGEYWSSVPSGFDRAMTRIFSGAAMNPYGSIQIRNASGVNLRCIKK